MKNTVLKFGVISGIIMSSLMLATLPFQHALSYDYGLLVGYTGIVLAFMLIFFGIRSYRDEVEGGGVGFWRALKVGSLIALISSCFYVATWEVVFFEFQPDFLVKMQAVQLEKLQAKGVSADSLAKVKAADAKMAEQYSKPLVNIAYTFLEPLPVGLVIALVSAGVLSRKKKEEDAGMLASAALAP
ncbi:MAG: hypothetical protein JWO05_909 [Gemmatimonadetes bacterium]|nr:hypothetical protein [Gemmatimonadota bacterium]